MKTEDTKVKWDEDATPFPNPQPRFLRSLVLIVLLVAVGSIVGALLYAARHDPPRCAGTNALPPLVETVVVHTQDVVERFMGYGTVRAIRSAKLAAEVASTVIERVGDIRAGSVVERGQMLIRFDDREYRHLLERAEALAEAERAAAAELEVESQNLAQLVKTAEQELRVAAGERTRLADLFEHELAAKKEYDFANLAYQRARRVVQGYQKQLSQLGPRKKRAAASIRAHEAEAALARLNIEKCAVQSPFAGRIEEIMVEIGDHVGVGGVVVTVIDSSRVEIPVQLPDAVYHRVKVAARCEIECESMVGNAWVGEVARIAPVADELTRTFAAYVVVDNSKQDPPLIPGTFVRAVVRGPTLRERILVPRRACRRGRVFVVDDDVARLRSVTTERFIEDLALLVDGVDHGERVILSHLDQLADGSPIRIEGATDGERRAAKGTSEAAKNSEFDIRHSAFDLSRERSSP